MQNRHSHIWTSDSYKHKLKVVLICPERVWRKAVLFAESDHVVWAVGVFALICLISCCFLYLLMRQRCRTRGYISALEKASDFIGNGLVFFDAKGYLISSNEQARAFLPDLLIPENDGIRLGSLTLQDFLDYFFDMAVDCDQSLVNALGRSAEKNTDIGFREVIMAPGNRLCLVETQKLSDIGTNLILIDVGDIRNQEEYLLKLNQYNHELNQAVQAATSGIAVTKPDLALGSQRVVFVNRAFCDIFQVSRDKILGGDIVDVFARLQDKQAFEAVKDINTRQEPGHVELRICDVEGGDCWYDLQHTPVEDHTGKAQLSIWLLNDMTALKMREAELSRTQKLEALGQLAAGVAHDFNNVLSIIDGYARMVGKELDEQDQALEHLERIRTASKRGADLIKKMLTFSRHEIVDDTVIDLGEVVREQEVLMRPLLDASVKCNVLTDHQPMYVECSAESVTQIIMNLVVNARDAMPDGGTVLLETRICPQKTLPEVLCKDGGGCSYASIIVSDTGTGMPEHVIQRIFDPFFTTKQQGQGTGLGLSMVYGLVKQVGGYIDVDSTVGQGTRMCIYLPLTDKAPKQLIGDASDISSLRFDGYTVLVAEDEPDLLALVSNMLEELGMNVLRAGNGNEALAVQDDYEGTIDLLLTDVVMPELNGVDLADLLKALRPDVKIIFMSGYPARGQMARVEIPEGAVFIAKPIDHSALIQLIHAKLSGKIGGGGDIVQTPRWASRQGHSKK